MRGWHLPIWIEGHSPIVLELLTKVVGKHATITSYESGFRINPRTPAAHKWITSTLAKIGVEVTARPKKQNRAPGEIGSRGSAIHERRHQSDTPV